MYKVLGVRPYGFDDKKTGEHVTGLSVHAVTSNPDNPYFIGQETFSFSFPQKKYDLLGLNDVSELVGKDIDILYNKYGKVSNISLLDRK